MARMSVEFLRAERVGRSIGALACMVVAGVGKCTGAGCGEQQ